MPTVGSQLKAARQARHLTLEEISKAIRVRVPYLEALEADDLSRLPSAVHARGFLRLYADYLGLDLAEVIERARQTAEEEQTLQGPLPSAPPVAPPPAPSPSSFWKKWIEAARTGWVTLLPRPRAREGSAAERIEMDRSASPLPEAPAASEAVESQAPPQPETPVESKLQETPSPAPSPLPPAPPAMDSAGLFRLLGNDLRQQRQALGLRLESIAHEIKIQPHILHALEEGDLESLPAPIITRNHLARYAEFLALDVDEILLRFADVLQARVRERGIPQSGKERQPILPRTLSLGLLLSGDLIFGILVLVALATFALWSINLITAARSRPTIRTTPIPEVLAQNPAMATFTPTPTEALLPTGESPTPSLPITPFVLPTQSNNVQIVIIALERVFLRVTVDGKTVLEERVLPGSTYTYEAGQRIELLAANAGGIRVYYNGNDLGLLGNFGEAVLRVFTAQGIATPTATLSPTPTITPTPSITPTPAATSTTPPRSPTSTPAR
ncbi:MAG: RodZ domain-containing protein [Anaerolineales bacterium]